MADPRVHPSSSSSTHSGQNPMPPNPPPSKPVPPPPTYVVQLPREQVLRYPPPENATKFDKLNNRKNRRSCCRRCCCFTFCLLFFLIIAAAAASAGVMYLVFRFKAPKYTVTNISIKGMNLTSATPISPVFDVSIRAENPNGKVGIYYMKDSVVNVFYKDVKLSDGVLPAFYQPKRNVTVLRTALTGSGVVLSGTVKTALRNAQSQGKVPLVVNVKAPVKVRVGSVKTWEITVKVQCDVELGALNERAKVVSNDCHYSVRLW